MAALFLFYAFTRPSTLKPESWKYYYEAENYLLKNPHTYKMIRNGDYIWGTERSVYESVG